MGTAEAPAVSPAVAGRTPEVRRQGMLRSLVDTSFRAVCLAAPSGYGKSTVLHQWAQADSRSFATVRAPSYARDPRVIVERIVAALQAGGLLAPGAAVPESTGPVSWHLALLPSLAHALAGLPEPVVVAVDDATSLLGPEWDSLLETLIDHLPPGSTTCIVTREDTPRSFRRRRSRGEVLELGVEALSMDLTETAEFLAHLGVFTDDLALWELHERTEGWPAAVYLGARALQRGAMDDLPCASFGDLSDFIRDEVFEPLDTETADFLLRSSVLSELDGPRCEAVTGREDAVGRLRELASVNHLLVPLDATGERFRLHHLLSDFLTAELKSRSLDDWRAAHAAASHSEQALGGRDQAVNHAVLAEDEAWLSQLVWEQAAHLLGSGQAPVLERWLDAAGTGRQHAQPRLAIASAWVAQHAGDLAGMIHMTSVAEQACQDRDCSELRPHLELLRASMALAGVEQLMGLSHSALQALPPGDAWRSAGHFHRGVGLLLMGHTEDALTDLQSARQQAGAYEMVLVEALALGSLVLLSVLVDDRTSAAQHCDELRGILAARPMDTVAVAAPVYAASAYGYLRDGRAERGRQDAETALRLTSLLRGMAPWHALQGRLQLAQVFHGLGDHTRAASLLGEAELRLGPSSSCPVIEKMLEQTRATVATDPEAVGPDPLTTAEIRVLQYLPTHLSFPEIAAQLFVSRYTIKTQVLATYRKLGVHSRSEAVERGRALGLLPSNLPS